MPYKEIDSDIHRHFMAKALSLAKKGRGRTSPNPMVGAIIVKNDTVCGKGFHPRAGEPHAEIFALKDAGVSAKGATIYVTLEPCSHYGRTPPCTKAIEKAGIKHVVIGMTDPNPLVAGSGIKYLEACGIKVTCNVLEKEARELNQVFIKYITTGIPFVTSKIAATLDGFTATKTGDSKWITNEKSRAFVHRLRDSVDAILTGVETVIKDNPSMTARVPGGKGKDPLRIVLDSRLRIPAHSKILTQNSTAKTIVVCTENAPEENIEIIKKTGALIMIAPMDKNSRPDIKWLLKELGKQEITSLLIEAGAVIQGAFSGLNLIDKYNIFFAPRILAASGGMPMITGNNRLLMKEATHMDKMKIKRFDNDIMIETYPL